MMDTIIIKGLEVFANHGVLEEENRIGQKFIIDAESLRHSVYNSLYSSSVK